MSQQTGTALAAASPGIAALPAVTAAVTEPETEVVNDGPLALEDLSPGDRKKWEDTMSMMVWTAPGFQHLFYKLLNAQSNTKSDFAAIMSSAMPNLAATDGRNIIINPKRFFSELDLQERTYVMGHEIIHNVYDDVGLLHRCHATGKVPMHDGTSVPFKDDIMQRAMDARINALLTSSRIGRAPKEGHFDKDVTGDDSVLDVYKRYYESEEGDGGGGPGPDKGNNPGGFDNLMKPGSATGQAPSTATHNQQQWAVEIQAAQTIEQVRTQGKMAGALKRLFQSILEPEVPWVDHIETLINRTVGDGGIDWTQPDPWFGAFDFFVPASTGKGAGWIVVWGDTSGSRSQAELASNMAELAGIMEAVNPARLTVLWCDADISYVDELDDPMQLASIQVRGAGGGGGTSYEPVLDWIAENGDAGVPPDLFIGFTDGYVSHRDREPPFPVIWASSTDHTYPFGQVVRVNKVKR